MKEEIKSEIIEPKNLRTNEKKKIFCIGYNKTGTCSLSELFNVEGYAAAPQRNFEVEVDNYLAKEPKEEILYIHNIINLINITFKDYTFFQDVPFSLPNFYRYLCDSLPDAKFILSTRNNAEDWYNSLLGFYITFWGKESVINLKTDKPNIFNIAVECWGGPAECWYNKDALMYGYREHINDAREYFKEKDNFIEINLSNHDDFKKLEYFLNVKFKSTKFPKKNSTLKSKKVIKTIKELIDEDNTIWTPPR